MRPRLLFILQLSSCSFHVFVVLLGLFVAIFPQLFAPICVRRALSEFLCSPAMDPSQQQMHHHLARALMHLNQLAALLPFFHSTPDWDSSPPPFSSHHGQASSRHLHTFVPLPTGSASSTSLASHGGLPSHYVLNPEPHLRAISYRTISHPDSAPPPTASHPSIPLRGPEGHRDNDMPAPTNPPPPRPKQASCSTAPRSLSIPPTPSNPDHTHS